MYIVEVVLMWALPLVLLALLLVLLRALLVGVYKQAEALTYIADGVTWEYYYKKYIGHNQGTNSSSECITWECKVLLRTLSGSIIVLLRALARSMPRLTCEYH
jgi:hypothetical protein